VENKPVSSLVVSLGKALDGISIRASAEEGRGAPPPLDFHTCYR